MSRSTRHTPCGGITTAESEKWDKRKANRRFRRQTKEAVAADSEPPVVRETSNVWCFAKDGKRFFDADNEVDKKWMRK